MRISYLCRENIKIIIKAQNNQILNKIKQNETYCNCAGSCKYPLKGGNCRSENKPTVIFELETKFYINLCST